MQSVDPRCKSHAIWALICPFLWPLPLGSSTWPFLWGLRLRWLFRGLVFAFLRPLLFWFRPVWILGCVLIGRGVHFLWWLWLKLQVFLLTHHLLDSVVLRNPWLWVFLTFDLTTACSFPLIHSPNYPPISLSLPSLYPSDSTDQLSLILPLHLSLWFLVHFSQLPCNHI